MRSVGEIPAFRSALRARSLNEIKELRALRYEHYLQTDWWRARRDEARRAAGYRCARCGVNRELQVHHLSYERLGAEEPADLEVLCRGCHVGEHFNETQTYVGLYTRIVSGVLAERHSDNLTEIVEESKARCVEYQLPFRYQEFQAAVAQVLPRVPFTAPARKAELFDVGKPGQPLSRAEASAALARLGLAHMCRHVPEVSREAVLEQMTYVEAVEDPSGRDEAAAHETAVRSGTLSDHLARRDDDSDAARTLRYLRHVADVLRRRRRA